MGDGVIPPALGELEMRNIVCRSIVAARNLVAGHILDTKDLAFQRPGSGLMTYFVKELIGRRLK